VYVYLIQHVFFTSQILLPLTEYNKQSLSPDEQRLFRLYGKLPSKSDHLKERKYFDSGDYALSKTGNASSVDTESPGT
jgi:cAMP-regulated phosphoprotein/endosulfine conserved region